MKITASGPGTYTVTYDGNGSTGGSVPTDATAYHQGDTVTVLGNTGNLVITGHIFAGWNTQADGSGTNYTAGTTFVMGEADVTLYAVWTGTPPSDLSGPWTKASGNPIVTVGSLASISTVLN